MVLVAHPYTKLGLSLSQGRVNFESDSFRVKLLSSYTVGTTRDTAQFETDVLTAGVATELPTGLGYIAGGVSVVAGSFTEVGHQFVYTGANPSWLAASFTASYALFIDVTPGSPSQNPVCWWWDFGGPQVGTGGLFSLEVAGGGLLAVAST